LELLSCCEFDFEVRERGRTVYLNEFGITRAGSSIMSFFILLSSSIGQDAVPIHGSKVFSFFVCD